MSIDLWFQTYTGRMFYPFNPRIEDICIEDIAHSLSMQCRFQGHCKFHYSIAQHSVIISSHVKDEFKLTALMHDASEAYLGDLIRPIKNGSPLGDTYKVAERTIEKLIVEKFNLFHDPQPPVIKEMDDRALVTERRDLLVNTDSIWEYEKIKVIDPFEGGIVPISPEAAKSIFMSCFREYGKS